MAELTCPPLGCGSVDFNAVNDAAKKAKNGSDIAAAIEKATTRVEAPAEVAPTPPAGAPAE